MSRLSQSMRRKLKMEIVSYTELKEIRGFRDDLERRVHDLRLSERWAMQSPSQALD